MENSGSAVGLLGEGSALEVGSKLQDLELEGGLQV